MATPEPLTVERLLELKTAAFHVAQRARALEDAAGRLGLDTTGYSELVGWADQLNAWFNPVDVGRIIRHGLLEDGTGLPGS